MSRQRQALYEDNSNISPRSSVLEPLEELIGYTFQKQSLLVEAMTHASFVTTNGGSRSLERLEFIGDAVLDKIIVTRLFAAEPPLTHDRMHTLKTALVNGDFLAFLSLEYSLLKQEPSVTENLTLESKEVRTPIWKFMRHASTAIGLEQAAIEENHKKLRGQILEEIERGMYYPWALLARIQARKFFSDLIEAVLGAVWIDSGSLTACQAILERLGVFAYLDRILRDRVQAQHPKELVGKYAVNKKVKYEMDVIEKEDGEREFFCTLHIGDRPVTRVGEGLSREEVQVKAAAEAVRILDAERTAMRID
jgi:dsRNA-specific ribonuclease